MGSTPLEENGNTRVETLWDIEQRTQKGSASVVGKISPRLNVTLVLPNKTRPETNFFSKNLTVSQNKIQNNLYEYKNVTQNNFQN